LSDIEKKKDDEFKPTSLQIRFAELYCDVTKRRMTYQEYADELGCSRMQLYRFRNDKRFMEWLQAKIDKAMEDSIGELILHGIRMAKRPDGSGFQFWKVLLEMSGKYIPGLKLDSALEPPKIQFIVNRSEEIIEAEEPKQLEGGNNDKED